MLDRKSFKAIGVQKNSFSLVAHQALQAAEVIAPYYNTIAIAEREGAVFVRPLSAVQSSAIQTVSPLTPKQHTE